jgi:putative intracellular protease/amidase
LKLSDIVAEDYDALFYPGGHGPLWDLVDDADSIALIETMYASRKAVAAVCHAPSVLLKAKAVNGSSLVKGKSVTGFSNSEEEAVQLTDVVPFLLENELIAKGANYSNLNSYNT